MPKKPINPPKPTHNAVEARTLVSTLERLRVPSAKRTVKWNGQKTNMALVFSALEMAGETGEACNVVKKVARHQRGMKGGIPLDEAREHLGEELADVVITADLTAQEAGIDLSTAVERKFNATSVKHGFTERMEVPRGRPQPRSTILLMCEPKMKGMSKQASVYVNGNECVFGGNRIDLQTMAMTMWRCEMVACVVIVELKDHVPHGWPKHVNVQRAVEAWQSIAVQHRNGTRKRSDTFHLCGAKVDGVTVHGEVWSH